MNKSGNITKCFITLTRLFLYHVGYTQMSSFVKLVFRYFIFSSRDRKSLPSIMIPQLKGHGLLFGDWSMGTGRRVKMTGICWSSCWFQSEQRPCSLWLCIRERREETIKWRRKCLAVRFLTTGFMTHVLTSFQDLTYCKNTWEETVGMSGGEEDDTEEKKCTGSVIFFRVKRRKC